MTDTPQNARGAGVHFTLMELDAMYSAASQYEAAGAADRREDHEAEFIFYRFGAGEIPPDGEGDEPNLPGIYMADADVPEEGVLPVITYPPLERTDAMPSSARPAQPAGSEPERDGRNESVGAARAAAGEGPQTFEEWLEPRRDGMTDRELMFARTAWQAATKEKP